MERDRAEGVARAVGKELGAQVAVQRDLDAGSQGIRSEMALMCSELDGLTRYDQVRPETAQTGTASPARGASRSAWSRPTAGPAKRIRRAPPHGGVLEQGKEPGIGVAALARAVCPAGSGPHPFPGHRMPPTTGGTASAARRLPLPVLCRRWAAPERGR